MTISAASMEYARCVYIYSMYYSSSLGLSTLCSSIALQLLFYLHAQLLCYRRLFLTNSLSLYVLSLSKIAKRSVKRYHPGRRPPHIRLRVTWELDGLPVRDDLTLMLTGAKDPDTKDPVSFVIECAPVAALQLSSSVFNL